MKGDVELRTKENYKLKNGIKDYRLKKIQNKTKKEIGIDDVLGQPFVYLHLVQLEKLRSHQNNLFLLQYY